MRNVTNKGFSVIELLATIAILGLLFALSLVSFSRFNRREAVSANASALAASLRDARARTLASVAGSQYGVKVDADRFTFFQGSAFSSSTKTNISYMYASGVKASSSISTLVFERVTGNSSASGTIDVYQASSPGALKRVKVQTTGLVSIE
jgi:prepilin-type N-terminal cleavage/methylation domain-containing protein